MREAPTIASEPSATADERLALAVVVRRPDDDRRRIALHRAGTRPSSPSTPRQKRTNGFSSHSRPIVVSSVCPGSTRVSCGSVISTSMTERRTSSADPPPTASRKSVSPEKQRPPTDERDAVVGMAGRRQRLDAEAARLDRSRRDLEAVALDELVVARDVIGVSVRDEQMSRRDALALDCREQRLERRAAVDEDRRPARLVREEEGVREPRGVHAPLDDHQVDRTEVRRGWENRAADRLTEGGTMNDVFVARGARGRRRPLVDLPHHRDRVARLRADRVPVGLHVGLRDLLPVRRRRHRRGRERAPGDLHLDDGLEVGARAPRRRSSSSSASTRSSIRTTRSRRSRCSSASSCSSRASSTSPSRS